MASVRIPGPHPCRMMAMTDSPAQDTYEFNVAVSFAGEDREFVEEVVAQLKQAGLRVFYDSDYVAEMWGEDLLEYLDDIYRLKARYTIVFISSSYAVKMWTRHERRSALARALDQTTPYVLPVRLDDAVLKGFRPTVGYLDARKLGLNGIVDVALTKLAAGKKVIARDIVRVPRTEIERQQVLVVCKDVCFSLRALDLAEDLAGVLGPGKRPGVVVPVVDEDADGLGQLAD